MAVVAGSQVRLNCSTASKLKWSYYASKDDNETILFTGIRLNKEFEERGYEMVNTYDVVIPQTRLENAGIYVCRATAVYGEAFAQLVILGMNAVIACQLLLYS